MKKEEDKEGKKKLNEEDEDEKETKGRTRREINKKEMKETEK